jgi:hypothetical protein
MWCRPQECVPACLTPSLLQDLFTWWYWKRRFLWGLKLFSSFLTDRKFEVLIEGEFSTRRKITSGVPQNSVLASVLYSISPTHLELVLLYSLTIPLFKRQRDMNVVFSANCNAASLQWIRGVSAGTWRSMKGKLRRFISSENLEFLTTYYN